MKYLVTLAFALLLAACNSKVDTAHPTALDGTYTSLDGKSSYTFTPNGKVQVVHFGKPKEATYTLENNTAKFQFDGGMPRTFVLNPDGSLIADGLEKFKKN